MEVSPLKRIILIAALVVAAALAAPNIVSARAAACSTAAANTPSLGSGIHTGWLGDCNVQWGHSMQVLQYESGGTWHTATIGGSPIAPTLNGPFTAGNSNADTNIWTGVDQTPYCSFNWRTQDAFLAWVGKGTIAAVTSPELHKSC